eukprot:2168306-Lingulodinium_polyedra.AAC.1
MPMKALPGRTLRLLLTALVAIGTGEAEAFTAAARCGRPDLAEVCCTADSVLSRAVGSQGGRTL